MRNRVRRGSVRPVGRQNGQPKDPVFLSVVVWAKKLCFAAAHSLALA